MGIDSNTGKNVGKIKPMATLILAWPKEGMISLSKQDLGRIFLADISIPSWIFLQSSLYSEGIDPNEEMVNVLYTKFSELPVIEIEMQSSGWMLLLNKRLERRN